MTTKTNIFFCSVAYRFDINTSRSAKSFRNFSEKLLDHGIPLACKSLLLTSHASDLEDTMVQSLYEFVYWVPPNGVYNAFNAAVKHSVDHGADWTLLLGSGDTVIFESDSVRRLLSLLSNSATPICNAMIIGDRKRISRTVYPQSGKWINLDKMRFNHPATIVPSAIYRLCGGYSENYNVAADYLWFHRLLCNNVTLRRSDVVLVYHELGGISTCPNKKRYKEHIQCLRIIHLCYGISLELFIAFLLRLSRYIISLCSTRKP